MANINYASSEGNISNCDSYYNSNNYGFNSDDNVNTIANSNITS